MKKFELTSESKVVFGVTLFKIRALVSFGCVVAGELGGWVEKEGNLDQDGDAWVSGDAEVYGYARVHGNAWVSGDAEVYGNAEVFSNAEVFGDAHYLVLGRIGSRRAFITFFRNRDKGISVACGCFLGTVAQFRAKVKETHGDNKHAQVYLKVADLAELQIDLTD